MTRISKHIATICAEAGKKPDAPATHTEPIYATSAYLFESADDAMRKLSDRQLGYVYSRWGNPTVDQAAAKIAALEGFELGARTYAQLFSSGMAAIASLILATCKAGDKVLTQSQLYGTTDELMQSLLPDYGIQTRITDMTDLDGVAEILRADDQIKLIYLETPSNPLIQLVDIKAIVRLAAGFKIKVAVDNTFCTPLVQQPLALGADFSIHSTTKFLNGHGTALGGVVVGKNKRFMQENLWRQVKLLGCNSNPFDAWLLQMGMKTLALRMERHVQNAGKVAAYLEQHPQVQQVFYAGSKTHPQYRLARKQMKNGGAMLSFELKGGLKAGKKLMNKVQVCKLVTSLGTPDTLVQHPASMTHVNVPRDRRLASGITDGLVRMSVGIEDVQDIIADLEQGLQ
jgi:methionine-gamma-lyase